MKPNFVISVYSKLWLKKSKELFIAEPYIRHFLEKNNLLKKYKFIKVASFIRSTREELVLDNDFINSKYYKYLKILTNRLNNIHGVNHSNFFWKKCLALDLIRYI